MRRLALGVDLGNTRLKAWDLRHDDACSLRVRDADWLSPLLAWRADRAGAANVAADWCIASVHAAAFQRLVDALQARFPNDRWRSLTHADVPLPTAVKPLEKLGIDRYLVAWAGYALVAGPVLVVDAGSAVTIDWVDAEGIFQGGAIVPGFELQLQTLGRYAVSLADAVDSIRNGPAAKLRAAARFPGRNTEAALAAGVGASVAGTLGYILRQIEHRGQPTPTLVLTGGDAHRLAALVDRPHRLETDLMRNALGHFGLRDDHGL